MCDPYQRFVVNDRVDVWMLGCILYTLCFYKQPFQECSKLSIVNAAFTFPKEHSYPDKLIDIIRMMLTPNPQHRPSIIEISNIFNDYFSIESIQLNVILKYFKALIMSQDEAQRIKEEVERKERDMKHFPAGPKKKDEDIPIEELINLQKKVQNAQKSNKNAPEFKEWKKVQYPQMQNTKSTSTKSNDEWGDFSSTKFEELPTKSSAQNEQGGSDAFDAFGQFSSAKNTTQDNKDNQQWNNFDFGVTSSSNPEGKSTVDNSWNTNLWDTPQLSSEKKSENNKEESDKKTKNDFDSFDFFGGTTQETLTTTATTEKKEETGDFVNN